MCKEPRQYLSFNSLHFALLSATRRLVSFSRRWADLLLPPVCVACARHVTSQGGLCGPCWAGITFIRRPLCHRLGVPLPFDAAPGVTDPAEAIVISAAAAAQPPAWDRARAVGLHDGVLRDLIHRFKYGDSFEAVDLFGRWLATAAAELTADADLIVPVPLARSRLWSRRYNQAGLLADALGRRCGRPVAHLVLIRRKRTRQQVGLSLDQRRRNVAAAFEVAPSMVPLIKGRRILLVDDVRTTGATLEAATKVLLRNGATAVDIATLGLVTRPERIHM